MSRQPKELIDGGIYHVYSCGNNRKTFFVQTEIAEFFIRTDGSDPTPIEWWWMRLWTKFDRHFWNRY
jgi:hypothetical protein